MDDAGATTWAILGRAVQAAVRSDKIAPTTRHFTSTLGIGSVLAVDITAAHRRPRRSASRRSAFAARCFRRIARAVG
jgi:hypothetical protein